MSTRTDEFGIAGFQHNTLTRLDRTEQKLDNGFSQLGVVLPDLPDVPAAVADLTVDELRRDIAARLCRIETKVTAGLTQMGVVPNDRPAIAVKYGGTKGTNEVHVSSLGVTFLNLVRALEDYEGIDFNVVYNGKPRGVINRTTGVDV